MRVLLTGGTGFVGANLARRLLREGGDVHLLVRPDRRDWRLESLLPRLTLHVASLEDAGAVGRVLDQVRPRQVFHLAASGAYPTQNDVARMVATNVSGTVNVLRAAADAGAEVVVNAGSSSEYGLKDHAPDEAELLVPNSPYAVTKAFATHFARLVAEKGGPRTVTLRLYSAYGPWEEPTRFVPTLVREGLAGRLPPLVDPRTARDFVFVEDVCDAFLLAASTPVPEPGAVFNVGTGRQTTIGEAVEAARRVFGLAEPADWGTFAARSWDTDVWVAKVTKIRDLLGWTPRHTFEEGLRETAAWERERRAGRSAG